MTTDTITINGSVIAFADSTELLISNAQAALEVIIYIKYSTGADRIAVSKNILSDEFFRLSTGLADKILEKLNENNIKIAIYGDITQYTNDAMREFIYRCSENNSIIFTQTKENAAQLLAALPR